MAADPEDRAGDGPRKADFLGAFHDLERVVATHLFMICANNSGSTFLRKALATSRRTWSLPWEGRKAGGYVGPRPARPASDPGLAVSARIWAARKRWLDVLEDPAKYDWPRTRKAWYFQAHARDPEASVFVQKSPEHLPARGRPRPALPQRQVPVHGAQPVCGVRGDLPDPAP